MSEEGVRLFWCLLVVFVQSTSGVFDVDEINSVTYGIDILEQPVLKGEKPAGGSVFLASKFGQQYQCTFAEKTREEEMKEKEEEKVAMETGIADLLKPMENNPCLVYTKGWWMYEFCFGKHIRQYHMEDGKITGDIIYLGVYASDYDWSNTTQLRKQRSWLSRYHSQQYTNGTECDLTGRPRKAEVKFFCEQTQGDYISRVDETETCVYSLFVQTSRICHHPYLKAPSPTRAVPITCNPLLTEEEYQIYREMMAEEEDKRVRQTIVESDNGISTAYIEDHGSEIFEGKSSAEDATSVEPTNQDGAESLDGKDRLQKVISDSLMEGLKNIFGEEAEDKIKISKMSMKTVKNSADIDQIIKETLEDAKKKHKTESEDLDPNEGEGQDEEEGSPDEAGEESPEYVVEGDTTEMEPAASESTRGDDGYMYIQDDEEMEPSEDPDVMQEFDQGLDDIVESEAHLEQIKEYKESLKQEINAQFDNILKEAEAELGELGEGETIDTETALKTMSDTLNKLMKHLDKKAVGKSDSTETPEETSQSAGDEEKITDPESTYSADDAETDAADNAVASPVDAENAEGDTESGITKMEYDVDYGEHKIQVKIFTSSDYYEETTADMLESGSALNKMIVAVLGGNSDEIKEAKRQEKMESNYGYVWNKKTKKDQSDAREKFDNS